MRRFNSTYFRDFDWVLLGFVLLLSVISVLEIKSATLQTKFRGFETKQVEFHRHRPLGLRHQPGLAGGRPTGR
jgi:cell division protein FtsW (lipid II flippase)